MSPHANDELARVSTTRNLITDYHDRLPAVIARCVPNPDPVVEPGSFSPGFALPTLDARMLRFYEPAVARWSRLDDYRDVRLRLLDLTGNPHTQTSKTAASLLIVARAVEYIRRTGEPVVLFSPTSGNKGTALRDAVERALAENLATPEQLRVVVLAPSENRHKLRQSGLSRDPDLRRLNPLLLYDGTNSDDVKKLGSAFVKEYATRLKKDRGLNIWYSLELENYLIADAARAFVEHDVSGPAEPNRVHAHAVSSAFGLLGYSRGLDVLDTVGETRSHRPAFLMVQHLSTPDMVLNLCFGGFERGRLPDYRLDVGTGLYVQDTDPRFPASTYDTTEILDPTFYTRRPTTSPTMNALIHDYGGGGIVVSLHECLDRYPRLHSMLAAAGMTLPRDPRELREWSLVMAMTGALNAVDRALLPGVSELVVHASGNYTATDFAPLSDTTVTTVSTVADILRAVAA